MAQDAGLRQRQALRLSPVRSHQDHARGVRLQPPEAAARRLGGRLLSDEIRGRVVLVTSFGAVVDVGDFSEDFRELLLPLSSCDKLGRCEVNDEVVLKLSDLGLQPAWEESCEDLRRDDYGDWTPSPDEDLEELEGEEDDEDELELEEAEDAENSLIDEEASQEMHYDEEEPLEEASLEGDFEEDEDYLDEPSPAEEEQGSYPQGWEEEEEDWDAYDELDLEEEEVLQPGGEQGDYEEDMEDEESDELQPLEPPEEGEHAGEERQEESELEPLEPLEEEQQEGRTSEEEMEEEWEEDEEEQYDDEHEEDEPDDEEQWTGENPEGEEADDTDAVERELGSGQRVSAGQRARFAPPPRHFRDQALDYSPLERQRVRPRQRYTAALSEVEEEPEEEEEQSAGPNYEEPGQEEEDDEDFEEDDLEMEEDETSLEPSPRSGAEQRVLRIPKGAPETNNSMHLEYGYPHEMDMELEDIEEEEEGFQDDDAEVDDGDLREADMEEADLEESEEEEQEEDMNDETESDEEEEEEDQQEVDEDEEEVAVQEEEDDEDDEDEEDEDEDLNEEVDDPRHDEGNRSQDAKIDPGHQPAQYFLSRHKEEKEKDSMDGYLAGDAGITKATQALVSALGGIWRDENGGVHRLQFALEPAWQCMSKLADGRSQSTSLHWDQKNCRIWLNKSYFLDTKALSEKASWYSKDDLEKRSPVFEWSRVTHHHGEQLASCTGDRNWYRRSVPRIASPDAGSGQPRLRPRSSERRAESDERRTPSMEAAQRRPSQEVWRALSPAVGRGTLSPSRQALSLSPSAVRQVEERRRWEAVDVRRSLSPNHVHGRSLSPSMQGRSHSSSQAQQLPRSHSPARPASAEIPAHSPGQALRQSSARQRSLSAGARMGLPQLPSARSLQQRGLLAKTMPSSELSSNTWRPSLVTRSNNYGMVAAGADSGAGLARHSHL